MADADPLLFQLIASFQASAMVQLGKVLHPLTGAIERDLEQAQGTIDLLAMLERKCKGNLTGDEQRFLEHVLFELRMNYLDESERPAPGEGDSSGTSSTTQPPAGDSGPAGDGDGHGGTAEAPSGSGV
jgi:hypothetical protein